MKLVHICSYFNTSSLYKNFFESLSDFQVTQEVFIPLYKDKPIAPSDYGTVREKEKNTDNVKYFYIECLSKIERYFLLHRIRKLYNVALQNIDIDSNSILHGHSLFANGGICYLANKRKGCKYVVAIRSTDLFIYSKLPIYRLIAKEIIKKAENIIFISYSLKFNFLSKIEDKELKKIVNKKGVVIPNGLPNMWFGENIRIKNNLINNKVKFIYQGTFHKRKKVDYIITLVEKMNSQGIDAELEIIGGGPEKDNLLKQINLSDFKNKIYMKDWTNTFKDILKNYQRNSIFIMPSENETFGVSYLEAMAVGLPIIYRKDDGIDGFFEDIKVGAAISGNDLELDLKEIKSVIDNYDEISQNTKKVIDNFRWSRICENYLRIYYELKNIDM